MARNNPVAIPSGVTVSVNKNILGIKGSNGELSLSVHDAVEMKHDNDALLFSPKAGVDNAIALAGTMRAHAGNMIRGVTEGFERRLKLVGVGYRAEMKGKKLVLTLGKSHLDELEAPEGVTIEVPSQTEVVVKGANRHMVGQVAANIRAFRRQEPYKGKGIRYLESPGYLAERIKKKVVKKK